MVFLEAKQELENQTTKPLCFLLSTSVAKAEKAVSQSHAVCGCFAHVKQVFGRNSVSTGTWQKV